VEAGGIEPPSELVVEQDRLPAFVSVVGDTRARFFQPPEVS